MTGLLIPHWYQPPPRSDLSLALATFACGFAMACGVFAFAKAGRQSYLMISRVKKAGLYTWMVWTEWIACVAGAIVAWLHINGMIESG